MKIGWTQPLCESCYVAWLLGQGEPPRQATVTRNMPLEPCLVCGTPTAIYTRIDPRLAGHFEYAKPDSDQ
jgi:hypothetical protein